MQQVDAVNKVNVAAWICFFFPGRTVSAAAVVTTISAMMSRRRVVNLCQSMLIAAFGGEGSLSLKRKFTSNTA